MSSSCPQENSQHQTPQQSQHDDDDDDDDDDDEHDDDEFPDLPLGVHRKVIYFVRHAEALHNVRERQAVAAAGSDRQRQEEARKAVLLQDASLLDAPLSHDGTQQAHLSGHALRSLFSTTTTTPNKQQQSPVVVPYQQPLSDSTRTASTSHTTRIAATSASPFRRPDVVLVSPLRRALMTATALFYPNDDNDDNDDEPPLFLAVEALREKRTGMACDERSSVATLQAEFPHVDFSDVVRASQQQRRCGRGIPPPGETNEMVRARGAAFLRYRLPAIPGQYLAVVSHKGWLRELRITLRNWVNAGRLQADFDIAGDWDKTLYGNAEVRVAAFRWHDGELVRVISRSVENAKLVATRAAMMGDGFEFAIGAHAASSSNNGGHAASSSGFSMFLADRTTKVHFICLAEGKHHVAVRQQAVVNGVVNKRYVDQLLRRQPQGASLADHPLFDARLSEKGATQAAQLRDMLAVRPSGGRPFTAFDLVLVSPLTRACETAHIIFGNSPGSMFHGAVVVPPPRILVWEECRERYGRYVCDARRTVAELEAEFPHLDWSEMPNNVDPYWNDETVDDERESAIHLRERSLQLLQRISARPERCVAVVTHAEFLRHLFGPFTDSWHEEDSRNIILPTTTANCELRSVVLCAHGPPSATTQQQPPNASDKPSSTIRIPSASSMSSLNASFEE